MGKQSRAAARRRQLRRRVPRASATRSRLTVPGRHNASNALAALAATRALGVPLAEAAAALGRFEGLQAPARDGRHRRRRHRDRRFRAQSGQDRRDPGDAARAARPAADHVPAARLRPAGQDGRGAGRELRQRHGARTTGSICPTRSIRAARSNGRAGRDWLAEAVAAQGAPGRRISPSARRSAKRCSPKRATGDRILIMGARDDTLSEFARELVERLASRN